MKTPRLLPVVIFAALALLLFKGIGLVTNGGYVLAGPSIARAGEAAPADAGAPSVDNAAPRTEPTLADTAPTLSDGAPTLAAAKPDAAAAATTAATAAAHPAAAGTPPRADAAAAAAGGKPAVPALAACPPDAAAKPAAPAANVTAASLTATNCVVPPVDALPVKADANGKKTPLVSADGASLTENAVLARLSDRRAELDKRESDLNMRAALVEAAEKQMQERADALKSLQDQINALVDQKKAMEDSQFVAIVNMYETMKPQDAAKIFDGLDMGVLVRVAKAMSPRKMAPVMALMAAARAQQLTMQLAAAEVQPVAAAPGQAGSTLPQIVGQ